MTAKEKAEELYKKMYTQHANIYPSTAKQCALITVNEMLNNTGFIWGRSGARDEYRKYWHEVKAEIEKM